MSRNGNTTPSSDMGSMFTQVLICSLEARRTRSESIDWRSGSARIDEILAVQGTFRGRFDHPSISTRQTLRRTIGGSTIFARAKRWRFLLAPRLQHDVLRGASI